MSKRTTKPPKGLTLKMRREIELIAIDLEDIAIWIPAIDVTKASRESLRHILNLSNDICARIDRATTQGSN